MNHMDAICASDTDLGHWARFLRRYGIGCHDEIAIGGFKGAPFEETLTLAMPGTIMIRAVFDHQGDFVRLDIGQ